MQRIIFPKNVEIQKKDPSEKVWLLPPEGQLYKINMHSHTTVSDGKFTPQELKELYMEQGYHAVAYTDHNKCVPHPELTDENFVALTGVEVAFSRHDESGYTDKTVHINAVARDPQMETVIKPMELEYDIVNRAIAELNEQNCIVTMNHPVFSVMSTDDLLQIHGMHGMEVYNAVGTMFNNYSDDSAFYEYFLRNGGRAVPIGGDDCHMCYEDRSPGDEYFKGFTVVKAKELTYDALIKGIDESALFASTGPMFHNLWLEGDMLHVECSPVCGVFVHGKYLSYKAAEMEKTDCLTHVEIDISGLRAISPYIWVQLRDCSGKKAWATPYWFQ